MEKKDYTLQLEDAGKTLEVDSEEVGIANVIIPEHNKVSFENGSRIDLYRANNKFLFVNSENENVKIETNSKRFDDFTFFIPKYKNVYIKKRDLNKWVLNADGTALSFGGPKEVMEREAEILLKSKELKEKFFEDGLMETLLTSSKFMEETGKSSILTTLIFENDLFWRQSSSDKYIEKLFWNSHEANEPLENIRWSGGPNQKAFESDRGSDVFGFVGENYDDDSWTTIDGTSFDGTPHSRDDGPYKTVIVMTYDTAGSNMTTRSPVDLTGVKEITFWAFTTQNSTDRAYFGLCERAGPYDNPGAGGSNPFFGDYELWAPDISTNEWIKQTVDVSEFNGLYHLGFQRSGSSNQNTCFTGFNFVYE